MYRAFYEELNKGYCYLYKRDRSFRPIFIISLGKLKKVKTDIETIVNMSTFLIQFIISRATIPGKIENWLIIIDMKGVGFTEIPKKLMKAIS
jgi:hypothetical protein